MFVLKGYPRLSETFIAQEIRALEQIGLSIQIVSLRRPTSAARHPGLGLLHFDAHADLREAYEGFTWSHASILFNVLNAWTAWRRWSRWGCAIWGKMS